MPGPSASINAERDLAKVSALRLKEQAERADGGKELDLSDLGLAENCTEVREMEDEEVRDAIRTIMVGVAQSIHAGVLQRPGRAGGRGGLNRDR